MTYYVGSTQFIYGEFTDPLGNTPITPSALTLTITDPNGLATVVSLGDPEMIQVATGVYKVRVAFTLPGRWGFVWVCTWGADSEVEPYDILAVNP